MRSLAARIERLEEVYSPAEVKVIFLDYFSDGEVRGCNGINHYRDPVDDGFRVEREPGESIEAFMYRAGEIAKDLYSPIGRNCLVLRLERAESLVCNLEPRIPTPEAVKPAGPVPADPAPRCAYPAAEREA